MTQTDEQREQYIRDLIRERGGANADKEAIDAELSRLGAAGKPPAKRATKLKKAESAD
jgi:hypothetical protein